MPVPRGFGTRSEVVRSKYRGRHRPAHDPSFGGILALLVSWPAAHIGSAR
jgi:hypothetical protein